MKKNSSRILAAVLAVMLLWSSCTPAFAASGKWIRSGRRWWYRHADYSYTVDGWEKIKGCWYRFDKQGWMQTGWVKDNGSWYYLIESGSVEGAMFVGYYYDVKTEQTYYLKPNGKMATGWVKDTFGTWKYFDASGRMARSQIVNGKYYVDADGAWIKDVGLTLTKPVQEVVLCYSRYQDGEEVLYTVKSTENAAELQSFTAYFNTVKNSEKKLNLEERETKQDRLSIYLIYKDTHEYLCVYPDGRLYCNGYDYTVDYEALFALYKAV
ncbi:MAG: hypothetical protein IJ168_06305 [Eubacterium sp.]|nr:hypothetical protein [Eubacterium sp.]